MEFLQHHKHNDAMQIEELDTRILIAFWIFANGRLYSFLARPRDGDKYTFWGDIPVADLVHTISWQIFWIVCHLRVSEWLDTGRRYLLTSHYIYPRTLFPVSIAHTHITKIVKPHHSFKLSHQLSSNHTVASVTSKAGCSAIVRCSLLPWAHIQYRSKICLLHLT